MRAIPSEPQILASISDAILSCDAEGCIRWCNGAATRMLGYLPDELIGANISMLTCADGDAATSLLGRCVPGLEPGQRAPHPERMEARRSDGSTLPVGVLATEVVVAGERLFTLVVRDATVGAQREHDLERARDELAMQIRVSQALEGAESTATLAEGALREIVALDQLHVHRKAGIFLLEEAGPVDPRIHLPLVGGAPIHLRLAHTIGDFTSEFLAREAFVAFGSCLCGRAAMSGRVIASDDCRKDLRHERCFDTVTPHGHYIIPLKAGGEVIGIVFLYTDPDPVWDERRSVLLGTLGAQIGMAFARARADEALRRSRAELVRLATYDALTGVLNRRAIFERLAQERARRKRGDGDTSVILFDIDHFKRVNDRHGHAIGDTVLIEVAQRMKKALRPYDEIGRYGGEEFLMVLPGCPARTAAEVAERLRRLLSETPIESGAGELTITASFGVAHCNGELSDEALVSAADEALYRAKRAGRDRVEVH